MPDDFKSEFKTGKPNWAALGSNSIKNSGLSDGANCYDYDNNSAFLFLLTRFTSANSVENMGAGDIWRGALKTEPSLAVDRLVAEGYLQPATLVSVLPSAFGSTQLKSWAKERGLPTSGTKDVLARRLAKADTEGIAQLVDLSKFFTCSERGREAVRKFEADEDERKRDVERDCLRALRSGQFREACLMVAAYEATKIFRRGMGFDWGDYNPSGDLDVLRFLSTCAPKRLVAVSSEALLELRVAAGMTLLWGTKTPTRWLSTTSLSEVNLEPDVGAMLLLSSAQHKHRIQAMKESGIKEVEVFGGGLEICAECQSHDGKVYDINKVPDIPFDNCRCENGCSCLVTAKM